MERLLRVLTVALVVLALFFVGWALGTRDRHLCKYNEYGYVRQGYQDGRYVGRCDDSGRIR